MPFCGQSVHPGTEAFLASRAERFGFRDERPYVCTLCFFARGTICGTTDCMSRFLGIDIGGTKCAVCVGDDNAQVLGRRELLSIAQKLHHIMEALEHGP